MQKEAELLEAEAAREAAAKVARNWAMVQQEARIAEAEAAREVAAAEEARVAYEAAAAAAAFAAMEETRIAGAAAREAVAEEEARVAYQAAAAAAASAAAAAKAHHLEELRLDPNCSRYTCEDPTQAMPRCKRRVVAPCWLARTSDKYTPA